MNKKSCNIFWSIKQMGEKKKCGQGGSVDECAQVYGLR